MTSTYRFLPSHRRPEHLLQVAQGAAPLGCPGWWLQDQQRRCPGNPFCPSQPCSGQGWAVRRPCSLAGRSGRTPLWEAASKQRSGEPQYRCVTNRAQDLLRPFSKLQRSRQPGRHPLGAGGFWQGGMQTQATLPFALSRQPAFPQYWSALGWSLAVGSTAGSC